MCLHECMCVCVHVCLNVSVCASVCVVCSFYLKSRIIQGIMDTYVYACICIYTL